MRKRRWVFVSMMAVLALIVGLTGTRSPAQDHGRDRDRDHDRGDDHDRDHGHHHEWDRDRPQFDDYERGSSRDWYDAHRDHRPVGFRDRDRLSRELESRFRVGVVLDPELRRRMHPAPADLLVTLPPPPRHYRYVVVGEHVCMVDDGYRLADVIHVELNF